MNISQFIDFFESKLYNIYGDNMEKFMNHNFTIGEITFANIVKGGTGTICHKNRKSHGIALFLGGERTFSFEDKKFKVVENTLFYFPKGSNYTIRLPLESLFFKSVIRKIKKEKFRTLACAEFSVSHIRKKRWKTEDFFCPNHIYQSYYIYLNIPCYSCVDAV